MAMLNIQDKINAGQSELDTAALALKDKLIENKANQLQLVDLLN